MRYTSTWTTANTPTYIQCVSWGGYAAGINCWYGCAGNGGYTTVVKTHARDYEDAEITTNVKGNSFGDSSSAYNNIVLMWVR